MNRETFGAAQAALAADVSRAVLTRVETLVRSLNGVADARAELDDKWRLRVVYVVAAAGVGGKALIRNVQSALRAHLDLALEPGSIVLMPSLPAVKAPAPAKPAIAEIPRKKPEPVAVPVVKPRSKEPHPVTKATEMARAAYRPTPQIEVLELTRFNHDQLQCRVVIELAGQRRTGNAIAGDERAGGVTLAARATLEALQTIEPGDWVFEGAADVIIGGQRHICASIRKSEDGASLTGAAPVVDSVERAVAVAVLNAAGLSNVTARQQNRRLVSR